MNSVPNWNVIIVDDEPDNIGVLKLVLDHNNAKVRIAESGVECLALMAIEVPNLLLVDIQMPGMSGYQLLQQIHLNERWKTLPIIAVSALAMEDDLMKISNAGFNGYIAKPVNVMTLIDEIMSILKS